MRINHPHHLQVIKVSCLAEKGANSTQWQSPHSRVGYWEGLQIRVKGDRKEERKAASNRTSRWTARWPTGLSATPQEELKGTGRKKGLKVDYSLLGSVPRKAARGRQEVSLSLVIKYSGLSGQAGYGPDPRPRGRS